MHLKSLEMIGFKSFAGKTHLDFEPGMTAIVGPNGCGKSNISDAIRWVLGEQSAKALRGSHMEDCIFNGTDTRKPLGMAEVSITFTNCEGVLQTEFNEVTVTRRVFRSGEGEYFLNKSPCRLKDIHRLFMDTGIGTNSYSLLEQGRIDQVLSSRPEERRTIFEEASGITKYKSDRKEAIRKLEQTEANLLRLADVIREVKRQIGSLQRQAGKAKRYKELRDELRKLDVFATRQRLHDADEKIQAAELEIQRLSQALQTARAEIEEVERDYTAQRESLIRTETEIGGIHETRIQAQGKLNHTREMIEVNRQRMQEYAKLEGRESQEVDEARKQLEEKRAGLDALAATLAETRKEMAEAEQKLKAATDAFEQHRKSMDSLRLQIQKLREESIQTESAVTKLQNQLMETETRERAAVIQRERLAAEKAQLSRTASGYDRRQSEMEIMLRDMQETLTQSEANLRKIEEERREKQTRIRQGQQRHSDLQSEAAALRARIEMLSDAEEAKGDFPAGARALLDKSNPLKIDPAALLGDLAAHVQADEGYEAAVEAALRAWLDAVVISDAAAALKILSVLHANRQGSARLLAISRNQMGDLFATKEDPAKLPAPPIGQLLIHHVRFTDNLAPLIGRLMGHFAVIDTLEQAPADNAGEFAYVTRDGAVIRADGCLEYWMPESHASNPLSRKHALTTAQTRLSAVQQNMEKEKADSTQLAAEVTALEERLRETTRKLDADKRTLAQKEGEFHLVTREAKEAKKRLDTVSFELDSLAEMDESRSEEKSALTRRMDEARVRRDDLLQTIQVRGRELHELETRFTDYQSELTESRIRFTGLKQRAEHQASEHSAIQGRIRELDATVKGRSEGILSHRAQIVRLTELVGAAEKDIAVLLTAVSEAEAKEAVLQKDRNTQTEALRRMEEVLGQRRGSLEELHSAKSELDVQVAERRMRRQNMQDRLTSEYNLPAEQLKDEPDPVWEGERPTIESIETQAAEIRTKIEAMGPVNLIAIEEYQELEERFTFLTQQEEDLIRSKQQLMDMIRRINRTSSDMFRATFDQVNTNFETMFHRLFNGGNAKLVLVNEEDVLECGIEIIARPPGKRLQNVSLLSGGERTLTAVALLFAIYLIKPSPFCLLDELDAALDEANINRFVGVLQDFIKQSQFVVITHNRRTIAAANVLYGVTMPEKGISKVVSMRFSQHPDAPPQKAVELTARPDAAPAAPAATPDKEESLESTEETAAEPVS